MSEYKYTPRCIVSRYWQDAEPDRFTVAVLTAAGDGRAYVVFTGCSTFLTPATVASEVMPWLADCVRVAGDLNRHDPADVARRAAAWDRYFRAGGTGVTDEDLEESGE